MSKRIAIIGSRGYPSTYGGFETLVRRLAPYLAESGDSVTVYGRNGHVGEQRIGGVRSVSTHGIDTTRLSTLTYGYTATQHARRQSYDAALVLNVANGFFIPTLKRRDIATVVNVDGIEWERQKWGRIAKRTFRSGARMTAKYADHLIYDSKAIQDIWQFSYHREGTFIPYGADVHDDYPSDLISTYGLTPQRYILAVARLVPENNIALFLEATAEIEPSPTVVVVGGAAAETPLTAMLRNAVRRRGVRWLGHVKNQELLAQLWAHCGAYFHGHSAGGTNPGLLQAMGYGAPTIALDTPFNREVLRCDSQLVPASTIQIADALKSLLDSPSERAASKERGQQEIRCRYQWADVLEQYRSVLRSV